MLRLQESRRKSSKSARVPRIIENLQKPEEKIHLNMREEWDLQYYKKTAEFYYGTVARLIVPRKRQTNLDGSNQAEAFVGV